MVNVCLYVIKSFSEYDSPNDSLVAQMVKSLPAMQETRVRSLGWEDPLKRKQQPTPVFLPGESHGQRSLAGYSPQGRKESDMTEQLMLSLSIQNKNIDKYNMTCTKSG